MSAERLYLFDTTLRDGAQTNGVDFSLEDKLQIATMLDTLGLDYIEGGYPGANPADTQLFSQPRNLKGKFTAFGMIKRHGRSVENDPGLQQILAAKVDAICFVAKAWDYHVRVALGCSNEDNIEGISQSIKAAIAMGKEALLDCEHFFDGYKANPDYALACARAAYDAGARWVVLCDTNGGTLPNEVRQIVEQVIKSIPGTHVGIHAHNDTEHAVANSLAAVRAGARQIQGTLNGIGERCGNANLISIIPTLMLKPEYADRFDVNISTDGLAGLTQISRGFDELLNRSPAIQAPYVGESAFATKAGIHASAIVKSPDTYEHVDPEKVGNMRRLLVSDQAGRSNILAQLERMGLVVEKDDPRITTLLNVVKKREAVGYAYEMAEASFELLARRTLGHVPEYFNIESYRVMVERRYNAKGELITVSEATVKAVIDGEVTFSAGEGNGPVNALDMALRRDLGKYSPYITDLTLIDYKVRVLTGGTDAVTRVLIESGDTQGKRWFTLGVSPNIVDASFHALLDSVTYKLYRDGAPPP